MKKYVRTILAMAVVLLVGVVVIGGNVSAKSGELEPTSDRVIFIKDPPEGYVNTDLPGDGSGKTDEKNGNIDKAPILIGMISFAVIGVIAVSAVVIKKKR